MQIDTTQMLVPNWYDREQVENMLGRHLTDTQWNALLTHSGAARYLADAMNEWMNDNIEQFV